MKDLKNFIYEYRGAIIGGIIAILILCTGLLKLALGILVICTRSILRKLCTTK